MNTHTHTTHTHTYTHTHTHTHTTPHWLSLSPTNTHIHTPSRWLYLFSHTHIYTHPHKLTQYTLLLTDESLSPLHTHKHTHTQTYTHMYTYTQIHIFRMHTHTHSSATKKLKRRWKRVVEKNYTEQQCRLPVTTALSIYFFLYFVLKLLSLFWFNLTQCSSKMIFT